MPELTPLEMDILHTVEKWGPMDTDRMYEIRLAAAVSRAAAEVFDLVLEGYLDMVWEEDVLCVVGVDGPVTFSHIVAQMIMDDEVSVFFDLEGEDDAKN